jgi:hypothetical protein
MLTLESRLKSQLSKSAVYRYLQGLEPKPTEDDVRLLLAIVAKSRDLLQAEYPGIQFRVLLWRFNYEEWIYQELKAGFAKINVPVDLVESILPDYDAAPNQYLLDPVDGHPNALADRLLAKYLVANVFLPKPGNAH